MRTQEESAKLRTTVIRRLRAKLDGDKTTEEASGSDTRREPESEANNPAPKIDHHQSEEHEWNIGTDHSDFDFYEDLEPDHPPAIPQEGGDGIRPLAHSSPNRNLTNNPVTKPVTPQAQTSQIDVGHPQDPPEINQPKKPWKQDDTGNWYNSDVCTEEDDEDEIGNAEPSEDEETKDN